MFSKAEKQLLAAKIEELLLSLNHPEMPKERPIFQLRVNGVGAWSWAEIQPNWTFDGKHKPGVNPWNEKAREIMGDK